MRRIALLLACISFGGACSSGPRSPGRGADDRTGAEKHEDGSGGGSGESGGRQRLGGFDVTSVAASVSEDEVAYVLYGHDANDAIAIYLAPGAGRGTFTMGRVGSLPYTVHLGKAAEDLDPTATDVQAELEKAQKAAATGTVEVVEPVRKNGDDFVLKLDLTFRDMKVQGQVDSRAFTAASSGSASGSGGAIALKTVGVTFAPDHAWFEGDSVQFFSMPAQGITAKQMLSFLVVGEEVAGKTFTYEGIDDASTTEERMRFATQSLSVTIGNIQAGTAPFVPIRGEVMYTKVPGGPGKVGHFKFSLRDRAGHSISGDLDVKQPTDEERAREGGLGG